MGIKNPSYFITNGDKYLSDSNEAGATIGAPASQAKRFKKEHAESTLPLITEQYPDWCIQKYFRSSSHKNYVITNATKFVGDNNVVVNDAQKARAFRSAADAESYIRSHGDLIISLGNSIIVNEEYASVDIFGKPLISWNRLNKINLERKSKTKKAARISLSKSIRLAVYERDKGICQICGRPLDLTEFTVDHIVPLNRGGINDISNYRCVCKRCNSWKEDYLDEELTQILKDVGSNYVYKHPQSDMAAQFVRMMVRGVINKSEFNNLV